MKPKVHLEPNDFLEILEICNSKIIKRDKSFLQPVMYVVEADDYYYQTTSKDPLTLPADRQVINSIDIVF